MRRIVIQTLFAIVFLCYSFGIDAGMGETNILNVTLKLNPSTRDMINVCCSCSFVNRELSRDLSFCYRVLCNFRIIAFSQRCNLVKLGKTRKNSEKPTCSYRWLSIT